MQQSSMMFYHKVYMNQIHSSSLLCQLAAMWKNQVLCDAVIKTGNISTKAHRVVLVAACPMLHSMKNASTGSNLEVRLAADISQEAVNTFLQYLYEGFMMLTEANCKDVEKIARVLQVDNVLKCCSDFYKCLHAGNGYEYNFHDNLEFRHVRASDLLKVHERSKRAGEALRADSPSTKRMRSYRTSSTDQIWQTDHGASTGDPWDRVPREGLSSSRSSQPGVIDMVEDSVEIVHTEPVLDSGGKSNSQRSISLPQDRVAISVASQINPSSDVQIIDTSYNNSGQSTGAQQDSISVIGSYSSPHYQHTSSSHSAPPTSRQNRMDSNPRFQTPPTSHKSHLPSQSPPRIRQSLPSSQTKPFAAGSATQSMGAMSPSLSSPARESPVVPSPVSLWRSQSAEMINVPPDKSPSTSRTENQAVSDTDIMSEVSIIKIESPDGESLPQEDDPNLPFKPGEQSATGEDASNEGSNLSTDKNVPQWLSESMKDNMRQASDGSIITKSPNVTFLSGRHGGVEMTNYLLIDPGEPLPPGYVRVDEEERVCVPAVWLTTTLRYCTGKPASFTIKKLLDGFINPWEYKYGGTSAYRNTPYEPIFNALMYMPVSHGKMLPWTPGYGVPMEQHALVPTEGGKLKPCALCTFYRVKTKSGWKVYTRRKCYACDVPLCHGQRNCFQLYHSRHLSGAIMSNSRSSDLLVSRMVSNILNQPREKAIHYAGLHSSEEEKDKGQTDLETDTLVTNTELSQFRIYKNKDLEPPIDDDKGQLE